MLKDFDQLMTTALESHHLNRTAFDRQVNRFLLWVVAWRATLESKGWTSVALASRRIRRKLLRKGGMALAPYDVIHSRTGQIIRFMAMDSCPRLMGDATAAQRDVSTTVLIYGDPQAYTDALDPDGNLSGLFDCKQQAWCHSVSGVVDYLGKPYQVAPDANLDVSRLVPSSDPKIIALFKHRADKAEREMR